MNKIQTSGGVEAVEPRRKLGKGLSSLIGTPVAITIPSPNIDATQLHQQAEPASGRVVHLPIDGIIPGRYQPRRVFDETQLAELASSIRSAGVVQPILVRPAAPSSGGAKWELIAGERRWRASRLAGLAVVPAVIAELTDEQAAEWSLIENMQRADLTAMEMSRAIVALCERFGLTHQQVGDRLGLDRATVTNLVRLMDLEREIQDSIDAKRLMVGHAKVLLSMPAGPQRVALAGACVGYEWSVRRLEQEVAAIAAAANRAEGDGSGGVDAEAARARRAGLKDLERQLSEHLGTQVAIQSGRDGRSGVIQIRFYDLDQFDGLVGMMGFVMK